MWDKLRDWVRKWLGVQPEDEPSPEGFARAYERADDENVTALIASKLSTLTTADSTLDVTDTTSNGDKPGQRVVLIRDLLVDFWHNDAAWVTAQALGKGGKLLVPTVSGNNVRITVLDQDRLVIREMTGRQITAATLLVDVVRKNRMRYSLLADYELTDGGQSIRYSVATDEGTLMDVTAVAQWANITPEIHIAHTDRLLLGYLRCPRDNRRDVKRFGVPITFGAENLIAELAEHVRIYRREYRLTRPMLALDSTLWRDGFGPGTDRALNIHAVRRTVQDSDDPFVPFDARTLDGSGIWQYYAPAIRQDAMEARYQSICRRIEKACGLSQGILTERQATNYANMDEVRAAQYDTYSLVRAMRDQWEQAVDDLAYAIDALAEHFGLTPAGARGQYALTWSWDTMMIESSTQAFAQNVELVSRGAMSLAELRQWVLGGSLNDAQTAVDQIQANAGADTSLLDQLGLGDE